MTEYRFGIEEEFFVVNSTTLETVQHLPATFVKSCKNKLGERVSTELLQSQLELVSPILSSASSARDCILEQRSTAMRMAASHGFALIASGTHPASNWANQVTTASPRYQVVSDELKMLTRRNLLCGLHVHVEVPDPSRRVELMTRLQPYLPLFVALSSSSPFWRGHSTGLLSYRPVAYSELPRTGLPPVFQSAQEYDDLIELLTSSGAIPDASYIWWAIRPASRFPTLELRASDACTWAADSLALASLFRCLVRRLFVDKTAGIPMSRAGSPIVAENMWRACRESTKCTIIDASRRAAVPLTDWLDELIQWLGDDAAALGVGADLETLRAIPAQGTSAHHQRVIYEHALQRGKSSFGATREVVHWLNGATSGEIRQLPRSATGSKSDTRRFAPVPA